MSLFTYLFIYLFTYLFTYLFIYLFIYSFIYLFGETKQLFHTKKLCEKCLQKLVRHMGQRFLGKGDHSLFFMDLVSIVVT